MKIIFPKILAAVLLLSMSQVNAATQTLRPTANTFVVEAGPALEDTDFADANDMNFGGSGSQSVASPTSRAYSPTEGIDDEPKGEFIALIKFDTATLEDTKILSMSLELNIINGNEKAFGLYNVRGSAGYFDVYMITNDWKQGNGSPEQDDTTGLGVTYNSLEELNDLYAPTYLATFYYDAAYPHSDGAVWYTFNFDISSTIFGSFAEAAEDGDIVTLMLKASDDSDVSFNYMGYIQNTLEDPIYRSVGPKLSVEYCPLLVSDINKDCYVDLGDFAIFSSQWLDNTIE